MPANLHTRHTCARMGIISHVTRRRRLPQALSPAPAPAPTPTPGVETHKSQMIYICLHWPRWWRAVNVQRIYIRYITRRRSVGLFAVSMRFNLIDKCLNTLYATVVKYPSDIRAQTGMKWNRMLMCCVCIYAHIISMPHALDTNAITHQRASRHSSRTALPIQRRTFLDRQRRSSSGRTSTPMRLSHPE